MRNTQTTSHVFRIETITDLRKKLSGGKTQAQRWRPRGAAIAPATAPLRCCSAWLGGELRCILCYSARTASSASVTSSTLALRPELKTKSLRNLLGRASERAFHNRLASQLSRDNDRTFPYFKRSGGKSNEKSDNFLEKQEQAVVGRGEARNASEVRQMPVLYALVRPGGSGLLLGTGRG